MDVVALHCTVSMHICAKYLVINTLSKVFGLVEGSWRSPRNQNHSLHVATVPDLNTQTTHAHVQNQHGVIFFFFFSPSDAPIIPAAAGTLAFHSVQIKTADDCN